MNKIFSLIRIFAALQQILAEKIELTESNIQMFLECANYVRKAGGLRKLHEFLKEADEEQLLDEIDSLIK